MEWLREHRRWRPDWTSDRPRLMWYLIFETEDRLRSRVALLHGALAGVAELDVVPPEWLHCTLHDVAPSDEVTAEQVAAVISAAGEAVRTLPAPEFELARLEPMDDSLVISVEPRRVLHPLQALLCTITEAQIGPHDHPDPFDPHVTIAYVNTRLASHGPMRLLEAVAAEPLRVVARSVTLANVTRHERFYDWATIARIPLGPENR